MSGVVSAVVFDVGGVLIGIDAAEIARQWARITGADPAAVLAAFQADRAYQRLERGEMSVEEYYRHAVSLIGRPMTYAQFDAAWNSLYRGALPGIEGLLDDLAGRVRLVALTNTNASHAAVWLKLYAGLMRPFERIFLSYEMGARKPEPACFRQVLDYLGLRPEEVVFIDDVAENVEAARQLGLHGIVAQSAGQIRAELARLGVVLP